MNPSLKSISELKRAAADAALARVTPGSLVGVGTGSTVDLFIEGLIAMREQIRGAVSSSQRSTERLRAAGIEVFDTLPETIEVYIDGADEITSEGFMIKGGGGALTREKIIASIAAKFVCIADESKLVKTLGAFGLPLEIIPLALGPVMHKVRALGAKPEQRQQYLTDNGCLIVDVRGLQMNDPVALERELNQWPGVVTVGLFAQRKADVLLMGSQAGLRTLTF